MIEIPEKFDSIEQANKVWELIQDEKNQKYLKAIDAMNLSKRIKEVKKTDDRKYFENVFSSILEKF